MAPIAFGFARSFILDEARDPAISLLVPLDLGLATEIPVKAGEHPRRRNSTAGAALNASAPAGIAGPQGQSAR